MLDLSTALTTVVMAISAIPITHLLAAITLAVVSLCTWALYVVVTLSKQGKRK